MTQEEFMRFVEEARSANNKPKEQELLEKALDFYPHWEWAKESMKNLTQYWLQAYTEYKGDIAPLQHKKICVFAHHDANKKIADYVVYWCKSLLEWDCAVIFISTCETLSQEEVDKIKPYVAKIIVRPNQGSDSGSAYIGFKISQKYTHLDYVVFVNDSIFGPFYPLSIFDEKLKDENVDVWGLISYISGHDPHYSFSATFWMLAKRSFSFMEETFFNRLYFTNNKFKLIVYYEERITTAALENNLRLKAFFEGTELSQQLNVGPSYYELAYIKAFDMIKNFQYPLLKRTIFSNQYHQLKQQHKSPAYPFLFTQEQLSIIRETGYDVPLLTNYFY